MRLSKKMKKLGALTLTGMMLVGVLAGCGSDTTDTSSTADNGSAQASSVSGAIDVVSREDGSGTRGAFIELFGIEEKNGDEKVDNTTPDAIIANQTEIMMQNVSGDENAIG